MVRDVSWVLGDWKNGHAIEVEAVAYGVKSEKGALTRISRALTKGDKGDAEVQSDKDGLVILVRLPHDVEVKVKVRADKEAIQEDGVYSEYEHQEEITINTGVVSRIRDLEGQLTFPEMS